MEVVVTEEKKKIFRARKTMKISDRQQLDSLHSSLLTAGPATSAASPPPPLVNGTMHKEDGPKAGDREQYNASDSNSPQAASPASPAPFLSLNLSPSPASSQSPKEKDETPTSPTSPFHSLNFELKKMDEEEEKVVELKEKKVLPVSSSKESVTPASTESKEKQEKDSEVTPKMEKKEQDQTSTKEPVVDLSKNSVKGLSPCSPVLASGCTEPMDAGSDTTKAKDPAAAAAKLKEEKTSCPKSTTSDSSLPCPSSSRPVSSAKDLKREKEIKEGDITEEKGVKKRSIDEEKMEVDSTKKEKAEVGQTKKPSRPSSTPPSHTVQEKGTTSGLKRTLSEGYDKDGQSVKREGKRPKVEHQELEAKLEFKFTAKAGSHHKFEKIVQQLVDERLRALELTIFDKNFQELKDRVDKIDCATKHQTAITTLQAKINRLTKKFGEANQASENKRKQEALAAVTAAAAAAAAAATAAAATAAAKTVTVTNSPLVQRVLRRQTVEPQPETHRERVAPSVGKTSALPVKKKKEEEEGMEEEEDKDNSRHIAMAKKLAEYNEGKCRADIKLRPITSNLEKGLYHNCKRSSGIPRPDRYASYLFRYLVPYSVYCDWVSKVNYIGLMGKEALPANLRRTMRMYIERRFPVMSCEGWREIRDVINEILRVERRPEFFREPVRTSMEVKQFTTSVSSPSTVVNSSLSVPNSSLAHTATSNAMVSQAPILQLITTTSNAGCNLATGITTQSPTGTLLLKTASGSSLMAGGQPLLIQLPLSMTNGQAGTLVNIPVSSLSAAGSLGKSKTTTSTATFILKPAPAITTSPASGAVVATVPALQASASHMSPAQISFARPLYQGGAGGITTPNAGVSVTTARTPSQSVSVAGALSSASSPATSGPAATGSTAPGPPQGTSLTSKTDNQATGSTPSKAAASAGRPKGSVIDLTEDDDDVQVTGVKSATVAVPSPTQRPTPVISIPNTVQLRSSPQSIQSVSSNPQLTVHHRPLQDSPMKPRPGGTSTPTRSSNVVLPPLPAAPAPSRIVPEAERSSPPQQPQLKLVPSQTGIVLSWCVAETDRTCAAVDSYHLYAFHQDNSNSSTAQQHWKKIGEVNALPLPMACTLTQFQSGSTYHFAVRAKDIYGRFGAFCEPQCTNVINTSSS